MKETSKSRAVHPGHTGLRSHLERLRPLFAHAAAYSLLVNLILIVPSIFFLQVFDRVLSSRSNETLAMLTLLAVGALGVSALFDVLRNRLLTRAAIALDASLGVPVLADLLRAGTGVGGTANPHALKDVQVLRVFLTGPGVLCLFDLPWLPLYLIVIFAFHPVLGCTALAGALVLVGIAVANERRSRAAGQALQTESRESAQFVEQSLRNAEVVAALGMGEHLQREWTRRSHRVFAWQLQAGDRAGKYAALSRATRQLLQVLMLAVGAWLVVNLHTSAGVMIAATLLLARALAPVEGVIVAWKSLVEARSAYARLDAQVRTLAHEPSVTKLPVPSGELSVERASFVIPGADRPLVSQISFVVSPGEALAIIGPSGSGKSTLARLLVGAWAPHAGHVRLDGADLRQWNRAQLGVHLGYLPQHVELFSGTVAQNIARMGSVDDARVIQAAQRAGVHELILRLPQGYDTPVGASGASLSGGQRQRIGLARALYGDPKLLVLDEPNSNLDAEGELALLDAIRTTKRAGCTVIVIAHRPSLVRDVDKVLVLREGRVEQFGPREEVLARLAPGVQRIHPNVVPSRRAAHV